VRQFHIALSLKDLRLSLFVAYDVTNIVNWHCIKPGVGMLDFESSAGLSGPAIPAAALVGTAP
jgi:hypothetical protein